MTTSPSYFLLLIPILPLCLLFLLFLIVRPRPSRIPIKDRHVFITGGSSGIGLALARQVAAEGARVSILARSRKRLEEAREAIRLATGVEVTIFSADVRDAEEVARAIEEAGPIDVLVCNQGVFVPQELEKQELEEVKFMVDVNLMGTFHLIKAALPAMKRRTRETGLPASITLMSSQAGQDYHVHLINLFCGFVFLSAEQKRRPELTKIIAGSSGGMKADDVAKVSLNGIKYGRFIIPCNFEGTMIAIATAGLSPQSSFMTAFIEVVGASFMRLVGLFFQWNWFSSIEKWQAKSSHKLK
ncbi:hypothetical protein M5K25_020911 [Dendrobium thyrsiflorum]|uniref:3-dehydrosphinganine reductase n=1 Tax=Dendrobium thyrsiflorum TaxID=117978 RepID=A0ABD0UB71_DENTH